MGRRVDCGHGGFGVWCERVNVCWGGGCGVNSVFGHGMVWSLDGIKSLVGRSFNWDRIKGVNGRIGAMEGRRSKEPSKPHRSCLCPTSEHSMLGLRFRPNPFKSTCNCLKYPGHGSRSV